jgi:hypothetical protein
LAINVDAASPQTDSWLTTISDSLAIPGNGAKLVGTPTFVSSGGVVYDKFNVDQYKVPPLDFLTQPAFPLPRWLGGLASASTNSALMASMAISS